MTLLFDACQAEIEGNETGMWFPSTVRVLGGPARFPWCGGRLRELKKCTRTRLARGYLWVRQKP